MISRRRRSNNVANGVSTKKRDVNDLLNRLDLYGTVQLPPAEVVSISGGSQGVDMFGRPVQIPASGPDLDILLNPQQRFLDTIYPEGMFGSTDEEYDAIRRQQLDFARRSYMGELTPEESYMQEHFDRYGDITASGAATPVYPMNWVSPSGDLEAIISSIGQAAEGDYLGGLLNGSLALGSIFLPGSVQVGSTKAGGIFEKVLDKQGQISKKNVLAIAGKEGVNKGEAAVLNKVAGKMGDKMDYKEFKQAVSDELSFEIGKTNNYADYGVSKVYSPLGDIKSTKVASNLSVQDMGIIHPPTGRFFDSADLNRAINEHLLSYETKSLINRFLLDDPNLRIDDVITKTGDISRVSNRKNSTRGAMSLTVGDSDDPFENFFKNLWMSNHFIQFDDITYDTVVDAVLYSKHGVNIDNIISNPDAVLSKLDNVFSDVVSASKGQYGQTSDLISETSIAVRRFEGRISDVKKVIEEYKQGIITEDEMRIKLSEYSLSNPSLAISQSADEMIEKKTAREIMNFNRIDPSSEFLIEKVSELSPEFREAFKQDMAIGRKFFDRVPSESALLSSPSMNFPVSNRHFKQKPSAHIRSFESPVMEDALFISELQSDALQGYRPNPETLVNRMKVDKSLIDNNADEYLKRMLSTEGYGYAEFGSQEYPSHAHAIMNHLYELGEDGFIDNARKVKNALEDLDTSEKIADFIGMDVMDVEDLELEEIVNDIERAINGASYEFMRGASLDEIMGGYKVMDDDFVKAAQKSQYKRLVQESTKIAADKGKKKVYFPTGETVSKIEGWDVAFSQGKLSEEKLKSMMRYYDNLDKDIKKGLGVNSNKVTIQGKTWWEVDIPESYLSGTQEIIAFGLGGKMRVKKRQQ